MGKSVRLHARDGFQSKWGFILACIGSAVGMGNIWRFPIMVTKWGGMTFLIPYFICVILIGCSGVIGEFALGRRAQAGPIGAFGMCTERGLKNRTVGELAGWVPVLGAMGLAIGYTVVISWIFKYTFLAVTGGLSAMGQDMAVIGQAFDETAPGFTTEEIQQMGVLGSLGKSAQRVLGGEGNTGWLIVGLTAALAIMALGVAGGIERANKLMMPVLFVLFVILAVYIAFQPGSSEGYRFIFSVNPSGLTNPKVWIYAFGQAFFSLSVAGNGSVIYGSYLSQEEDIPSSARNVALFDTLAALLAMMVIVPAIGVSGLSPHDINPGPGLMFVYLVNILNGMPGGHLIGVIFYVAILFAGLSSIINLYEAPVATLQERFGMGRIPAVIGIGAVGGMAAILIQVVTSQWMDVVSIYICPLGALLAGVMFYWIAGKDFVLKAVNQGAKRPIGRWYYLLAKYVYCMLCVVALAAGAALGGIG